LESVFVTFESFHNPGQRSIAILLPAHSLTVTMLLRLRSSFSPVFRHRCLLAATTSASADAAAASRGTKGVGVGDVVGGYSCQQQTQQRRGMAFQKSFVSFFVVAIMLDLLHQLLAWICVDRSGC
jgi:hypothetical protein